MNHRVSDHKVFSRSEGMAAPLTPLLSAPHPALKRGAEITLNIGSPSFDHLDHKPYVVLEKIAC